MNIVNVGYDSTNYYVLATTQPKLLIDVGWPGTLSKLQHECKRNDIQLSELRYLLVTHYHPDHAGLAQELKRLGIKLIVIEVQRSAIPVMRTYMKPSNHYVDIDLTDNLLLGIADSRAFLAQLGIEGEIISTPGHSDDSISVVLDDGVAFVGDLTHPMLIVEDTPNILQASWAKIRALGGKTIYPGHGPVWQLS